jgi:hypothetical protein
MLLVYRVGRQDRGQTVPPPQPSQLCHHGVHLVSINGDAIPCHAILGLPEVATDHAIHHAAHELIPGGLIVAAVLYTCLGGIVEELIILNPQGSIPGFVGCPTVVGRKGGGCVGHGSFRFDVVSLQGQRCPQRA